MNVKDLMLREINQIQKDSYCVILITKDTSPKQICRDRKYVRGYQGLGKRENEDLLLNSNRIWLDVMKIS